MPARALFVPHCSSHYHHMISGFVTLVEPRIHVTRNHVRNVPKVLEVSGRERGTGTAARGTDDLAQTLFYISCPTLFASHLQPLAAQSGSMFKAQLMLIKRALQCQR
ncbi:hypothetical protein PoB_001150600 [Plakobranchus ocellatus]|uniref:Uncharacterized protein n=1 Tax=Plakobranchus ocellatus TaxID=259542 RepID=A0AAV3YRJ4_9GAST|nr:hypothetical protein PoB_001150600 [Plakobranchus ocellatus]